MITAAAILVNGVICTMPKPARHHHIIHALTAVDVKAGDFRHQGFAAAILVNGVICTMPKPARHHHIIHALTAVGVKAGDFRHQGFIDDNGAYWSRKDALSIAMENGQVEEIIGGELTSEDLW